MDNATRRLYEQTIPQFAEYLDRVAEENENKFNRLWSSEGDMKIVKWALNCLTTVQIHKHKINVRHLGKLRTHVTRLYHHQKQCIY